MGNKYAEAALAKARKAGLTAAHVAAWDYRATAAASGVTIGPKGESPRDFFHQNGSRAVWSVLAGEEEEAYVEQVRLAMQGALQVPAFGPGITVTFEDGLFGVSSLKPGGG